MTSMSQKSAQRIANLEKDWKENPRWNGIKRPYSASDVERLRGTLDIDYTLAKHGAEKLWKLLLENPYISGLGALTGNQAMQQVKAGLKTVYVSGWQVASDANLAGEMYPDQNLYPCNSVPALARSINKTLQRYDQVQHAEQFEGRSSSTNQIDDWFVPLVADGEAGFGGILNTFELTKSMIESGVSGIHFEDQLSSARKFGPGGGKCLVPTKEAIEKLVAARLASDVLGVSTILIARTDAQSGNLITSNIDPNDKPFLTGEKTPEGCFITKPGLEHCICRALAYAPYSDLIWFQTDNPDIQFAKKFAEGVHAKYPNKMLMYNLATGFNWKKNMKEEDIIQFQKTIAAFGYKYQFVTVAGFHTLNYSMFDLALKFKSNGMGAYADLQEKEIAAEKDGFTAAKYQKEVGTGYFETVGKVIQDGLNY